MHHCEWQSVGASFRTTSGRYFATLMVTMFWLGAAGSGTGAESPVATTPAAAALVEQVVTAAGGRERLLQVFRLREQLVLNPDGVKTGMTRVSVLHPPHLWWVGKKERVSQEREPAIYLVWAWSLGAITDPKSQLTVLPALEDGHLKLIGLRVSSTIDPPLDLYFNRSDYRLVRIDWRKDVHRFSEYRELNGLHYPSRTTGHKPDGRVWYQTDILELEPLSELPAELRTTP